MGIYFVAGSPYHLKHAACLPHGPRHSTGTKRRVGCIHGKGIYKIELKQSRLCILARFLAVARHIPMFTNHPIALDVQATAEPQGTGRNMSRHSPKVDGRPDDLYIQHSPA